MRIAKKKVNEPSDPHIREAHIAESREKHAAPTSAFVTPTAIPMQPITPIPVATPSLTVTPKPPKNELLTIKGIDEETAAKLGSLGINNIDDLAEASAEDLVRALNVDLSAALKWSQIAKKLH
ncbi:MAG TPA: helix-hairpin-helix domain-containing protein [Candidatus Bathyarchaeia archaeon]